MGAPVTSLIGKSESKENAVPWTQFHDMHSGGGCKEPPYEHIFIEAPEAEAKVIFYNRFGHNPDRVTCTCCGQDYSLTESADLAQATGFERGCKTLETPRNPDTLLYEHPTDEWFKAHYYLEPEDEAEAVERGWTIGKSWGYNPEGYRTVEQYIEDPKVLVIRADEIKPEERVGEVPDEGYVWV
jgi:hypothetical protein